MKKTRVNKKVLNACGAALALSLIAANVNYYSVEVDASTVDVNGQATTVIPGSLSMKSPAALSTLALPASAFGTLSWANPSTVPSQYSGSYPVVLKVTDTKGADFSKVPGWNAANSTVTGSVTVVVESLAPATPAPTQAPETPAATPVPTQAPETPVATPVPTQAPETPGATTTPEDEEPADSDMPQPSEVPSDDTKTPDESETPDVTEAPQLPEAPSIEDGFPDEEKYGELKNASYEAYEVDEEYMIEEEGVGAAAPATQSNTYKIAGSKPLVGGNIANNGYGGSTAKPTSTPAASSSGNSSNRTGNTGSNSSTGSSYNSAASSQTNASSSQNTGSNYNSGSTSKSGNRSVAMVTTKRYGVLTGDDTEIFPYAATGIFSMLVAAFTFFTMRSRRKVVSKATEEEEK